MRNDPVSFRAAATHMPEMTAGRSHHAQPERQGPARDAPRRTASTASAAPFADDFQARLAYQTLRAVAIDRERARPAP